MTCHTTKGLPVQDIVIRLYVTTFIKTLLIFMLVTLNLFIIAIFYYRWYLRHTMSNQHAAHIHMQQSRSTRETDKHVALPSKAALHVLTPSNNTMQWNSPHTKTSPS